MNKNKPKVLVLGSFHFQGSSDIIQPDSDDLITEQKQREIEEVVKRLSEFEPTKVAVEAEK